MSEKIYCGSAKIIKTQYGDLLKGSMHRDDLKKVAEWMHEKGVDWFNFSIKEKREPQEGKPTHYLELDQWVIETAKNQEAPQPLQEQKDNLPF